MKGITYHTSGLTGVGERSDFTFLERIVLMRFHPISLLFSVTGLIWFSYFLWQNNWQYALAVMVAARLLALSIVWRIDYKAMAATPMGKLGLLHIHPVNLVIQIAGAVAAVWALWTHSTPVLLAGISVLILGHAFGWSQVNPGFSLHEKTAG